MKETDYMFAGNITLKEGTIDIEKQDMDIVQVWEKTYFLFWEIDVKTSKELLEYLSKLFGEIEFHDISISSEEKVELFSEWYSDGVYELVSFEWADVNFSTIVERFWEVEEVCIVREAENSEKFWNKIIKVEFLY